MLELPNGIKTNSQVRVQDEVNLHNQKKRQLMQVEWKWCNGFNRDNLKHKLYTACNLWEETSLPSLYYTLCFSVGITSKCHIFLGTFVVSKLWMFIFLSNQVFFLKMWGQCIITLKKIFPTIYSTPQSSLIWPLLWRDLWSGVKFPIWFMPLLLIIIHANQV
jgi:hypothetical protein